MVTGGEGTIAVTHDGKTYYVCCTGCRDYFNENPAEVLAEYRERKAADYDRWIEGMRRLQARITAD